MDYKNGKIYKIVSDNSDKIYIGSTTQLLSKRHHSHRRSYIAYLSGKSHFVSSFKLFELGNTDIILLENFPCNNKEELYARERYYIELNKNICVNMHIPTRTDKEYYEQNKPSILINVKQYRQNNIESIKKKEKIYREKNKLTIAEKKKTYQQENAETLKEKKKIYNEQHKQEIRARLGVVSFCGCGTSVTKQHIKRHNKSAKHIKYITEHQPTTTTTTEPQPTTTEQPTEINI